MAHRTGLVALVLLSSIAVVGGCRVKRVAFDDIAESTALAFSYTTTGDPPKPNAYFLAVTSTTRCVGLDDDTRVELSGQPMKLSSSAGRTVYNSGGMSPAVGCAPTEFELAVGAVTGPLVFTVAGKTKSVSLEPILEPLTLRLEQPTGATVRGGASLVFVSNAPLTACTVSAHLKGADGAESALLDEQHAGKIDGPRFTLVLPKQHKGRALPAGAVSVQVDCTVDAAIKRCTAASCSTPREHPHAELTLELVP